MSQRTANTVLTAHVIRRLLASVLTLVGLSVILFALVEILPGDYADISAGRISSFEAVDRSRGDYGLDQSIPARYWAWFSQAVQGEFGNSWWTGTAIGPLLATRLWHTAWLALLATVVALPLGIGLGLVCAIYAGRVLDRTTSVGVLASMSIPEWVIAYALMYLFAVKYSMFPVHTFFNDDLGLAQRTHATVLPALSLAALSIAPVLRMTRVCVINTFKAPYIQMAQLKGISVWRIVWRHALPNALAPICNIVVLAFANLMVGVVIVESIFSYPGFGHAFLMAAKTRDLPLALACGLISGALYLTLNLLADLATLFGNPRLRYPSSSAAIQAPIIPPLVSQTLRRPRVRIAAAALGVVLVGALFAYSQLTRTDDVTHAGIHAPFGFRTALKNAELLQPTDGSLDPVHYDNFLPVGQHRPARASFEGVLKVPNFKLLGRPSSHPKRAPGYIAAPGFQARFVTIGDQLVAADRGVLLDTMSEDWSVILDDGRLWAEPGDGEQWSRASFPFTFVNHQSRYAFNAVATFIYNANQISELRVQIAQESAPDGEKYDYWGQTQVTRSRRNFEDRKRIIQTFETLRARAFEVRPWRQLEEQYDAKILAGFEGPLAKKYITVAGLLVDNTVYVQACLTRFGPHPYCRSIRQSVYSITKTLGATISMLYLAEQFGEEVFRARVLDYVTVDAQHDGWHDVTFGDLLNMSSGVGDLKPEIVDEYVDTSRTATSARFFTAPSAAEKLERIAELKNYPWGPSEVFRYQDTDFFTLSAALDGYVKARLGPDADLWETLTRNVFEPLGIGQLPVLRSLEPDGKPGVPLFEAGAYPTFEQALKLGRLIQNQGRFEDKQLLHRELTARAANHVTDRGLRTRWRYHNGVETYYEMGLWLTPYVHYDKCAGRLPFMVGFGGNYVGLMPNNIIAFRFADGWDDDKKTWDNQGLQTVSNNIRPFCATE